MRKFCQKTRLAAWFSLILLAILLPQSRANAQITIVTNTYFVATGANQGVVNGGYWQLSPGAWANSNALAYCEQVSGGWAFESPQGGVYYAVSTSDPNPPTTGWWGVDQAPTLTYYTRYTTNYIFTNTILSVNSPQKISTLPVVTNSTGIFFVCNQTNLATGTNTTVLLPFAAAGLAVQATNVYINADRTLTVVTNGTGASWTLSINTNLFLNVSNGVIVYPSNFFTLNFSFLTNSLESGGVIYGINSNELAVQNQNLNVLPPNSGLYVSLYTNLSSVQFTNTPRFIIGPVASYDHSTFDFVTTGGGTDPSAPLPEIDWSDDGGVTWSNGSAATFPVLLSVYCPTTYSTAQASNLTVYSYFDPALQGKTNDFTGETTLVYQTTNPNSAVNLAGAQGLAAQAASKWSQSPASSALNLDGNSLVYNYVWTVAPKNAGLSVSFSGVPIVSYLPSNPGVGTNAVISKVIVTNGIVALTINSASPSAPNVFWETNITSGTWSQLSVSSATNSGGYWYITAPLPSPYVDFFKAVNVAYSASATVDYAAAIKIESLSSVPTASQIGGSGTQTNHLLVNFNGVLVDYWANGTTVWSKQLAP